MGKGQKTQVVKMLSKREMLILIRNDMLRELCVAEINVGDIKRTQLLSVNVGSNPQLTTNLTNWEGTVKKINGTISVVDGMLKKELVEEASEKKIKN